LGFAKRALTDDTHFDSWFKMIDITGLPDRYSSYPDHNNYGDYFYDDDDDDEESKKKLSKNNSIRFQKVRQTITAINRKLSTVTAYLVTLQSNKIIGEISPVDEKSMLDLYKKEGDPDALMEYSKKLDDEYDRFMAEIELSQ
jgi:hypothetical protein